MLKWLLANHWRSSPSCPALSHLLVGASAIAAAASLTGHFFTDQ